MRNGWAWRLLRDEGPEHGNFFPVRWTKAEVRVLSRGIPDTEFHRSEAGAACGQGKSDLMGGQANSGFSVLWWQ